MAQQAQVGIIGAGYEGFRPIVSDLSTRELMFEAASKAYKDASIDVRKDVGSFVCCTEDLWEGWSITDEMVPDQIGGAKRPVCTVPADAITGLGTAFMQIASGLVDVVVLEAHSKAGDVLDKEGVERLAQDPSLIRPLGMNNDALAALEMAIFMRSTGYALEDLDGIIGASQSRALRNPRSSFHGATSGDGREAEGGRTHRRGVISTPLRRVDKAPFAEGGVVLVLASEDWIRSHARKSVRRRAVFIDGVSWNTSLPWFDGGDASMALYARNSTRGAMKRAGLSGRLARLFDILEIDDTYSYKCLQHLHSISRGRKETMTVLDGDGPALNPSGGALGAGNLLEASAMRQILETVLQLRGEAGEVQVKSHPSRGLVISWRGVPTATGGAAILSRENA